MAKVELSGQQVKDILEHIGRYYRRLECTPDGECTVITDPAIPHYNVDSMAGVSYHIDPTRPEGDRIQDLRFGGLPLDLNARFTVACTNYRAAGGGGYPHLADAEVLWSSSAELTEVIGEYLKSHNPWHPGSDRNWWIGAQISTEKPLSERP
jgi:2',3'-cyclic-nucleotide 2'-phosphodiesterase/3'-nucleotidase